MTRAARTALVMVALAVTLGACASDAERQHRVAEDPHATVDEIVAAGSPVDIVVSHGQILVTWQVEPDDDEGPYKGAWRLYTADDDGNAAEVVADGSFGTVREQSARIDAWPVDDGYVLSDYRTDKLRHLDRRGGLTAIQAGTRPAKSLAGGMLIDSETGEGPLVLKRDGGVTPLPKLPTRNPQDVVLDERGELWVMLPWKDDGPIRVAHATSGKAPWTLEIVPVPRGSSVQSYTMSADDGRVFLPTTNRSASMDRQRVNEILTRRAGPRGTWTTLPAAGISDRLTAMPDFEAMPGGGLLASTGGEGQWVLAKDGRRWRPIKGVTTADHSFSRVFVEGGRLWSAESWFGTSLNYSTDGGKSWTEFDRD